MIWLTALGLALGVAMILTLGGVIFWNGLSVFWPKPVVEITLSEGSRSALNGTRILAGEVTKKQLRPGTRPDHPEREWQLYLGNRDLYGFSFRYIAEKDILETRTPPQYLMLERMEYGNALAVPVRITEVGGKETSFRSGRFDTVLKRLVEEAGDRRRLITRIEKFDIGSLNQKIEDLRLKKKKLQRTNQNTLQALSQIDREAAKLQSDYEVLAGQARELRAEQDRAFLTYRVATGEERRISLGKIVSFYYPNRMTTWERVCWFGIRLGRFVSEDPREANTEGGIFPAIFGTFVMTILMSLMVTPFGVMAAIYLREYAKPGFFVRMVRIAVNNLAGVPSIVFGVFGLGFFVYGIGGMMDQIFFADNLPTPTFGTGGVIWASLTLALMTVPVVIVSTEEALASVPRGAREGSLALGASKWQTIQRVVLPASTTGILTGFILAMARGAGEVAPLMLVGVVKLAPSLPVDGLFPFIHAERKFMHLGFHIYDLGFQSPDSEAAKPMVFATTMVLLALVLALNASAIEIRKRLKRKYALGAF